MEDDLRRKTTWFKEPSFFSETAKEISRRHREVTDDIEKMNRRMDRVVLFLFCISLAVTVTVGGVAIWAIIKFVNWVVQQ